MSTTEFRLLMQRARQGDATAADELVRRYEPVIRRAIRIRLVEPRLQRYLDSSDICQSVIRRALGALGDETLPAENPRQLVAWLIRVAHNRFNQALRRLRVVENHLDEAAQEAADKAGGPADTSQAERMANRELVELVCSRLNAEERDIAERYSLGESWETIASALGGKPDALRKRFFRALQRAAGELGLGPC